MLKTETIFAATEAGGKTDKRIRRLKTLTTIAEFTLLESDADYHQFVTENVVGYPTMPDQFPAFAKTVIDGSEDTHIEYLLTRDLWLMAQILEGRFPRMDIKVAQAGQVERCTSIITGRPVKDADVFVECENCWNCLTVADEENEENFPIIDLWEDRGDDGPLCPACCVLETC